MRSLNLLIGVLPAAALLFACEGGTWGCGKRDAALLIAREIDLGDPSPPCESVCDRHNAGETLVACEIVAAEAAPTDGGVGGDAELARDAGAAGEGDGGVHASPRRPRNTRTVSYYCEYAGARGLCQKS